MNEDIGLSVPVRPPLEDSDLVAHRGVTNHPEQHHGCPQPVEGMVPRNADPRLSAGHEVYPVAGVPCFRRFSTRILNPMGCMVGNDLTRSTWSDASGSSTSSLNIVAMVRLSWTRNETATEAPVVTSPEGSVGAALPVFAASRCVAIDVEAPRVGKILFERVADGRTYHDLGARGYPVAREVERVGGHPQHGGRDRMKPKGLHRHATRDVEPSQPLAGHGAFEQGVGLGGQALHELRALQHVVDHERRRARRGIQADHVGREHSQGQVGLGKKLNFANYRIRALLYAGKPNWDPLPSVTPP